MLLIRGTMGERLDGRGERPTALDPSGLSAGNLISESLTTRKNLSLFFSPQKDDTFAGKPFGIAPSGRPCLRVDSADRVTGHRIGSPMPADTRRDALTSPVRGHAHSLPAHVLSCSLFLVPDRVSFHPSSSPCRKPIVPAL